MQCSCLSRYVLRPKGCMAMGAFSASWGLELQIITEPCVEAACSECCPAPCWLLVGGTGLQPALVLAVLAPSHTAITGGIGSSNWALF